MGNWKFPNIHSFIQLLLLIKRDVWIIICVGSGNFWEIDVNEQYVVEKVIVFRFGILLDFLPPSRNKNIFYIILNARCEKWKTFHINSYAAHLKKWIGSLIHGKQYVRRRWMLYKKAGKQCSLINALFFVSFYHHSTFDFVEKINGTNQMIGNRMIKLVWDGWEIFWIP